MPPPPFGIIIIELDCLNYSGCRLLDLPLVSLLENGEERNEIQSMGLSGCSPKVFFCFLIGPTKVCTMHWAMVQ
jgi:hypothetical protein